MPPPLPLLPPPPVSSPPPAVSSPPPLLVSSPVSMGSAAVSPVSSSPAAAGVAVVTIRSDSVVSRTRRIISVSSIGRGNAPHCTQNRRGGLNWLAPAADLRSTMRRMFVTAAAVGLWAAPALAGPLDRSRASAGLEFTRDAAGVAAAVGEALPTLQACIDDAEGAGTRLLRLRFAVAPDGVPGPVEPLWAAEDAALADCLSAPFAAMRFASGEQALPVEIPISVRVEESSRTEVRAPAE